MANITSSDPRKAKIVARLKELSGARSVTKVTWHRSAKEFSGHCLNKGNAPDAGSRGTWAVYDCMHMPFAWRTLPGNDTRLRSPEAIDL